jgi:hypothetical protein
VLIGGALVLAENALAGAHHSGERWHAWQIIVAAWLLAGVAALVGMLVPDRGDRHRVASYVVPSVGAALLMPLTIHMPFLLHSGGANEFDEWVQLSGIFVGIAHIVFAAMVGMRARAIVEGRTPVSVGTIYGVSVAMACVPGLVIFIPPVVTAVTGIPILPMLMAMERWGKRARLEAALPTAMIRDVA